MNSAPYHKIFLFDKANGIIVMRKNRKNRRSSKATIGEAEPEMLVTWNLSRNY